MADLNEFLSKALQNRPVIIINQTDSKNDYIIKLIERLMLMMRKKDKEIVEKLPSSSALG